MTTIKGMPNPLLTTRSTSSTSVPAQNLTQMTDINSLVQAYSSIVSQNQASLMDETNQALNQMGVVVPPAASVPEPDVSQSGPATGDGLKLAEGKWPKGSVTTAGGYTIVPEGNTKWSVYAPNEKPGDKPYFSVSGDPHVYDSQGKKEFDFSKSSDFVLPDGTRIACKTSAETGHSLSSQLDITNGTDHVQITGLTGGSPKTGEVTNDGAAWREKHIHDTKGLETFTAGGSQKHVEFFKDVAGINKGEVTGADYKGGSYEQTVDNAKSYVVDPSLKPAVGSKAYQEMLQDNLVDQLSSTPGMDLNTIANLVGTAFPHDEYINQILAQELGTTPDKVDGLIQEDRSLDSNFGGILDSVRQGPWTPFGGIFADSSNGNTGIVPPNFGSDPLSAMGDQGPFNQLGILGDAMRDFQSMIDGVLSGRTRIL